MAYSFFMSFKLDASRPRKNRTRYDLFWRTVNWKLPDSVIATVWNTDRGNLHARRVRLRQPLPRWRVREDGEHPVFKAAIHLEKLKAKKFTGAKPANSSASKDLNMKIAAELSLELIKRNDDGRALLDLHLRLLGVDGKNLHADIDADEDLTHPRITASADTFGFSPEDVKVLSLAAYNQMLRYFGAGPTGGTIKWARWVEVDLAPWIRQTLYRPAAGRIIRNLSSLMGSTPSGIAKAFTESLEV
jgi:hypothetical protein